MKENTKKRIKIFSILAPRSTSQLRPVKAPRSQSAVPKKMQKENGVTHSLELLEQLSLTRDEWIDYFKTKKLPPKAELELKKLQNRVPENHFHHQNMIFPNNPHAAPFVTKL